MRGTANHGKVAFRKFQKYHFDEVGVVVNNMETTYVFSVCHNLIQGFPIWGTCAPRGTMKGKLYVFPNILTYKSSMKISVDFDISYSFIVIRNFRGTCSSVEML